MSEQGTNSVFSFLKAKINTNMFFQFMSVMDKEKIPL